MGPSFSITERECEWLTLLKVSGSPGADSNVRFVAVDYSNVDALVLVLEEHNVDTVISTVNNITGENQSELNLIEAAERSKTTNRFIPSYFGIPYLPEYSFSVMHSSPSGHVSKS